MRLAVLFNGQGEQQPAHLLRLQQEASREMQQALTQVLPEIWHAPEVAAHALAANAVAQPLIFALQMHAWNQLQAHLPQPLCVAGYSLGEMAACCAAGVFSAEQGIALCATRAHLMDSCLSVPAGLLAVLGLARPVVEGIAQQSDTVLAIRNSAEQFILGGLEEDLLRARALAQAAGAQRVVRLAVHTPSHTPLLRAASRAFLATLQPYLAAPLRLKVLSAIDGRAAGSTAAALQALAAQICQPLDWSGVLDTIHELQPDLVLEIGPGNALSRLWRERDQDIPIRAWDDFRSVDGLLRWVALQQP